jgi:hypothetical protein
LADPGSRRTKPGNLRCDSLAGNIAQTKPCRGSDRVVTRIAHIGARELIADAAGHPVQRQQSHLECETRLAFDVIACAPNSTRANDHVSDLVASV